MDNLFLTILNMSLTGAFVIAAISLARLPLKKAPKIISYCLWAVAGFRLLFPFSIESIFSLMPFNSALIPADIATQSVPRIDSGIPFVNVAVSGVLPAPAVGDSVNPLQVWTSIGAYVWIFGVALMIGYGVVSYFVLKRKIRDAVCCESNIYEADNIKSPFVLGVFNPKIYLPLGLSEKERGYIVLHERTHIRRYDHIVKFTAYFILCLHWFNPLAWVAFLLMGVDMEMSCDERVLKEMGGETKKEYSLSLLSLATERRIIGGSPLAFGEGGVKQRIKNVLNFKKPSRMIISAAIALAAVLSVGFALDRANNNNELFRFEVSYNASESTDGIQFILDNTVYSLYGGGWQTQQPEEGSEIGFAVGANGEWYKIFEREGYSISEFIIATDAELMSPAQIYMAEIRRTFVLEDMTEEQRMTRLNSVTIHPNGTASLKMPPISSYATAHPLLFTLFDGEFLIHYENGDTVARFEYIDGTTLILKEASSLLFADVGARYSAEPIPFSLNSIAVVMYKSDGQVWYVLFDGKLPEDWFMRGFVRRFGDIGGLNAELAEYSPNQINTVYVWHTSDFTKEEVTALTEQFKIPSENFSMGTGLLDENSMTRAMTLNDVRTLSQYIGADLTMADLRGYSGTDIGSGIFVMQYEVETDYVLIVGSPDMETVAYAYLMPADENEQDDSIDIRFFNVDSFVRSRSQVLTNPLPND
jgi:beta-lactamase regulating signal transducer with metallopeptidase domain